VNQERAETYLGVLAGLIHKRMMAAARQASAAVGGAVEPLR
jgi:hypothetical protein